MKVAVIGAGLIGRERLTALRNLIERGRDITIVGLHDPYAPDLEELSATYGTRPLAQLQDVFEVEPDWIFVATPHDVAADAATACLRAGFRVLLEKPLGRDLQEAKAIVEAAPDPARLYVGFDYRFFDGVAAAYRDLKDGAFGDLISISLALGHGGNPKDRTSWKLDPVRAGGGCLIDPGIHLIDLARWFTESDLTPRAVTAWSGFWNTGIEEECHALLTAGSVTINLQVSVVRWRSTFRLEINGDAGYGIVSGRNRSYGPQRYVRGERWGWQKAGNQFAAETLVLEGAGGDVLTKETEQVLYPDPAALIQPCSAAEALENMTILERCRAAMTSVAAPPVVGVRP